MLAILNNSNFYNKHKSYTKNYTKKKIIFHNYYNYKIFLLNVSHLLRGLKRNAIYNVWNLFYFVVVYWYKTINKYFRKYFYTLINVLIYIYI